MKLIAALVFALTLWCKGAWSQGPEPLLLKALSAIQQGQIDEAEAISIQLQRQYPAYRLGQLLSFQLNALLSGNEVLLHRVQQQYKTRYNQLLQEARLRWQHAHQPQPPEQWVKQWILNPGLQRWWVVVDLSASRLYLFENRNGSLKKVEDFFVSIGQRGIGKQREGDRRTPVGLYHITRWVPGHRLPKLYGAGALTLNYPNPWDRKRGRTGSGIWLHGTPPNTYVRPPKSSKGCVVLNNQAVEKLVTHYHLPIGTPVLLLKHHLLPSALRNTVALKTLYEGKSAVVRYPGEFRLLWRGWRAGAHWHEQYWQADGEGGWQLALQVQPDLKVAHQ